MKTNKCPICERKYKMTLSKKDHNENQIWWPKNQCGAHLTLKRGERR